MQIISSAIVDTMNQQIKSEFTASAQYVAIAVYFDDEGLPDLAGFFYRQAEEERMHGMKFVHFMLDAGVRPTIPATPELRNEFTGAADAVQYALEQEVRVTNEINNLVTIAKENKDHTSENFLQWFVTEQVEEISSMTSLLQTIRHAGPSLLLVEDYVRRIAAAPAAAGEAE
jgi:ferritin